MASLSRLEAIFLEVTSVCLAIIAHSKIKKAKSEKVLVGKDEHQ